MQARLITIPFSHYCEKARWVLDATGLDYREEPHPPVAHLRATRAVGGKTVPVLVHGDRVLCDSTDIVRYADDLAPPGRRLLPDGDEARARVFALEEELDETLGIEARRLAYWYILGDQAVARAFVGRALQGRARAAWGVAARIFRRIIFRRYRVNAETARRAEERLRASFARIGVVLERQPYLAGDSFTLADVTFAALAAPVLGPPEHPVTGGMNLALPEEFLALRADLAATTAGAFALRLYRTRRAARAS